MGKGIVKKYGSIVLVLIAVILIASTLFTSESRLIVGTWQSEDDGVRSEVEFSKNGTGSIIVTSNGKVTDSRIFGYILRDGLITITGNGMSSTTPFEISRNDLLVDGDLFHRKSGGTYPLICYVLAIACLIGAFRIHRSNNCLEETPLPTKITHVPESEPTHMPKTIPAPEPEVAPTPKPGTVPDLDSPSKPHKKAEEGAPKPSGENKWFKSAGDL